MITSKFPANPVMKTKLWNLWRTHKLELKDDGFRLSKYRNQWSVAYFCDVDDTSLVKPAGSDDPNYMIDFKTAYAKWTKVHEEMVDAVVSKPYDDDTIWFVD
jgi:hypothetical protein